METLGHAYAYISVCTHAPDLHVHAYAYTGICAHAKVPKTMKDNFSAFKTWFWNESHIV